MKNILQFQISKGDQYYVASGVDLPIVSQAKTLDELVKNLTEAVQLHLAGENLKEMDLGDHPHILVNMEVSETVHA